MKTEQINFKEQQAEIIIQMNVCVGDIITKIQRIVDLTRTHQTNLIKHEKKN